MNNFLIFAAEKTSEANPWPEVVFGIASLIFLGFFMYLMFKD